MSNNEDKNFVRVGSSSSKYLFYLQLGAPLFPAGVQEYNDCQSQCVGSLGNMHLRGEITKLFIIATDKTDTTKTYVHTHLQMGTISNSISDIQKNILASTIFTTTTAYYGYTYYFSPRYFIFEILTNHSLV